jgi:hypothetical protein
VIGLRQVKFEFQYFMRDASWAQEVGHERDVPTIRLERGEHFLVVETFDTFVMGRNLTTYKVLTREGIGFASEQRVLARSEAVI